jgi:hypothetical protein
MHSTLGANPNTMAPMHNWYLDNIKPFSNVQNKEIEAFTTIAEIVQRPIFVTLVKMNT